MKTPILGAAYVARSVNAADNRMVNLFPEMVPEGGKEPAFLQRVPGTVFLNAASGSKTRGLWASQAYPSMAVLVASAAVARIDTGGTDYAVGAITNGTSMATFADCGDLLMIATGVNNTLSYVYNWATYALTQITDGDFIGGNSCAYLSNRAFVAGAAASNRSKVQCSAIDNPLAWDALDVLTAASAPDGVVAIKAVNDVLFVFGPNTTEVWADAGTPGFPLAPIQGATSSIGCMCYASVATIGDRVYWLGRDQFGQCVIYRNNGYGGERISTHAVEWQIQQYDTPEDAVAYVYQQNGHSFYVITFDGGNATWVYDITTEAWHERASWDGADFNKEFANCAINFPISGPYGDYNIIVGSSGNAAIFGLAPDVYGDATVLSTWDEKRWLRSWRALAPGVNTLKRTAHHSLQLDCESGVSDAVSPLTYDNGSVFLRWSDDGGHTWSTPQERFFGGSGETGKRVIWRRLGMTTKLRDRVYEISGTDPNKVFIMGAELIMSQTNA